MSDIPVELLTQSSVQVFVLALLLIWVSFLSILVIKHGNSISELHGLLTNHYSHLPERVEKLEKALTHIQKKSPHKQH